MRTTIGVCLLLSACLGQDPQSQRVEVDARYFETMWGIRLKSTDIDDKKFTVTLI